MLTTILWRLNGLLVLLLAACLLAAGCAGGGADGDDAIDPGDPHPVISLEAFPQGGTAPITLTFDATGCWAKNGAALTYDWDFDGDGSFELAGGTDLEEHRFEAAGEFDVTLRITDTDGLSSSKSLRVTITAGTDGGGGGEAEVDPIASLLSYPDGGEAPVTITLDASGSWSRDGQALTYEYDFDGDGSYDLSTAENLVEHTYETAGTFTPGLRVTDSQGHSSEDSAEALTITAGSGGGGGSQEPVASLLAYPATGEAPLEVTLDASGSWAKDGKALTYEYDFDGDGTYDQTSNAHTVEHTYTEAGTYTPGLRVTDGAGNSSTAEAKPVVVSPGSGGGDGGDDQAPVAVLVANPTFGPPPLTVQFDANLSLAIKGSIVSYDWDMDNDGSFELLDGGPTQQHSYSEEGFFYVTVRVTDSEGLSGTQQAAVVVNSAL